ncbi:integrase, partial [Calderihabitans maritimus]
VQKTESTPKKEKKTYRPPDTHYYKYGRSLFPRLTFEESDREILKMLEEIFLSRYA